MAAVFDIELHDADDKTQEDSDDDNTIEVEEVYFLFNFIIRRNNYRGCLTC